MNYKKVFISGFMLPALVFTGFVVYAQLSNQYDLFIWEFTLGSFIWGFWNVGYFGLKNKLPKLYIGLWGAFLGLLFGVDAIIRSTVSHSEAMLSVINQIIEPDKFDFFFHKLSIIWLPILYFFLWYYPVRWLNNLWGCKC